MHSTITHFNVFFFSDFADNAEVLNGDALWKTPILYMPLLKYAYSNIFKISPPKTESFQIKKSDIFHFSDQNIDCGYSLEPPRQGGSNEYPQSMFFEQK